MAACGFFDPNVSISLSAKYDAPADFCFEQFAGTDIHSSPTLEAVASLTTHDRPQLDVGLNMLFMRQELAQQGDDVQDPRAWSTLISRHIGTALRQAAWEHLVNSKCSRGEFLAWFVASAASEIVTEIAHLGGENLLWPLSALEAAEVYGAVPAGVAVLQNAYKAIMQRKQNKPLSQTCYSFTPGFHLERYASVNILTGIRRFARAA